MVQLQALIVDRLLLVVQVIDGNRTDPSDTEQQVPQSLKTPTFAQLLPCSSEW